MAEQKLEESSDTDKPKEVDAVIFQVLLDEKEGLPKGLEEFEFKPDGDITEKHLEKIDNPAAVAASIGQRQPTDIRIERYLSQGSKGSSLTSEDLPLKELPDSIPYFSGIPAVEVVKGLIHLFRDRSKPVKERPSCVVCILGVPAHLTLSDLLKFIEPIQKSVKSIQVVRDSTPNQYMVILKFKDKLTAEEFHHSYHMKRYSSFEKGVCQLVYASRIEVVKGMGHKRKTTPSSGITEIPSCSICLERLDDTVLTILCNHSFHTNCLTKWEDTTCPVCRYTQIPEISSENTCSTCDSREDLWICLVCGHVGCGRYIGGHAYEHFSLTHHTYTLQVGTQRVWDYVGDNYVHRLVQNKTDGKLVQIEGANNSLVDDEKVDSLQLEYTYLLTSQLESQRMFFEEKLERTEKDAVEQIGVVKNRLKSLAENNERLSVSVEDFEKERKDKDRKISQLQTKFAKTLTELREEQELNKCMSDNQKAWRERVTALEDKLHSTLKQKDMEIVELKDQVKDLMFYMETQQKISEAPDDMKRELQDGQLVMSKQDSAHSKGGAGKKTRKKGRNS